ncbi:hypothetical protein N431DRAFT_393601 [Stipitochalara longipes BDJ]|nr:hypothetical protein N431DRAFT_393601 [Stipitochalara longipes BDJ]
MDPLTAVGAVASVVQLAQTALSLSKTLYSLGAAVASASDDIQVLAQDLKTFSQSLTILSRLLEDSKSWYSDDIYLLTARIIKDCAELYVKIDKILVKLGSSGKSTWKLRVKFVYKEAQIKKLMKQLRDMKGTLATILMSLQVDLQLSLLNISSSSKIQRPPEKPLQPETINTLREAQKAVEQVDFLPKYSETLEGKITPKSFMETGPSLNQPREAAEARRETMISTLNSATSRNADSDPPIHSNVFGITQSFVVLPSIAQTACPQGPEKDTSSSTSTKACLDMAPKSIKSSSSTESFKSAISMQQMDLEVARQVKAVRAVMHAFRTAIQILHNLIERRMPIKRGEIYVAAKALENSLYDRSKEIDERHSANFREHGQVYIEGFDTKVSVSLQEISSIIMREIVMKLHEVSAEHEDLSTSCFDDLCQCSENCSRQFLTYLNQLAPSFEHQFSMEMPTAVEASPLLSLGIGRQFQGWGPKGDERSSEEVEQQLAKLISSSEPWYPDVPQTSNATHLKSRCSEHQESATISNPELSLPFIGYAFKRFGSYARDETAIPEMPISRPQVPAPANVLSPSRPSQSSTTQARFLQDNQYALGLPEQQNTRRPVLECQTSDAAEIQESQTRHSPGSFKIDNPAPEDGKEQLSISDQNISKTVGDQVNLDRDLTFKPNFKLDVLQDFDFDSFLHQDEDSSKFELPNDESGSTFIASRTPYTPVYVCNASFKFTKQDIESRFQESGKACNACIAHDARCDARRPTCINCHANSIECEYDGQAHAEKQNNIYAVEEEAPIFVNAKQFHRILRRRAARQALEKESATRNHHQASSHGLKKWTTYNKTINSTSQASQATANPNSLSQAHTQGDRASSPREILTSRTSPRSDHVPVDISETLRSSNEKLARSVRASARFCASQKAKKKKLMEQGAREKDMEAEEFIEGPVEQPAATHRPTLEWSSKDQKANRDPFTTLFVGPSTNLPPKISSYPPSSAQESSPGSDLCLSLSPSQETKLWWRSLAFIRLSNFAAFQVLRFEFLNELSIVINLSINDEMLCKQVSTDIKGFEERKLRREPQTEGLNKILDMRTNILRIVSTIDDQMGLQVAILGWSCVCIVLHVYEDILREASIDPGLVGTIKNAHTQLQEVVAIIARYAVMENLYHRSGSALSLTSEYRSSLLYLCSTILEYFSVSVTLGRAIHGFDSTAGEQRRLITACEQLMITIREKDHACQRFQVVVEAREESKSESEADIDDLSDDSWEEILAPSIEDDLIDLDAALV